MYWIPRGSLREAHSSKKKGGRVGIRSARVLDGNKVKMLEAPLDLGKARLTA